MPTASAALMRNRWDSPQFDDNTTFIQREIEKLISGKIESILPAYYDKRISTLDPSFYDCIYSLPGTDDKIIQRCYKDMGCCATDCCTNSDWQAKYGWAVALIGLFSLVVILTVLCWSAVWICERHKDRKLHNELYSKKCSSVTSSQMSLAYPIPNGYHFGTGPFQSPPQSYPTKY